MMFVMGKLWFVQKSLSKMIESPGGAPKSMSQAQGGCPRMMPITESMMGGP